MNRVDDEKCDLMIATHDPRFGMINYNFALPAQPLHSFAITSRCESHMFQMALLLAIHTLIRTGLVPNGLQSLT